MAAVLRLTSSALDSDQIAAALVFNYVAQRFQDEPTEIIVDEEVMAQWEQWLCTSNQIMEIQILKASSLAQLYRPPMPIDAIARWMPATEFGEVVPSADVIRKAEPEVISLIRSQRDLSFGEARGWYNFALFYSSFWDEEIGIEILSSVPDMKARALARVVLHLLEFADKIRTKIILDIYRNVSLSMRILIFAACAEYGHIDLLDKIDMLYLGDCIDIDLLALKAEAELVAPNKIWSGPEAKKIREKLHDLIVSDKGHLIHKLKAKDTTGRWAYYFVLVEKDREMQFLTAIEGDSTIDLEDFGSVVASCYGVEPSEEIIDFLHTRYGFDIQKSHVTRIIGEKLDETGFVIFGDKVTFHGDFGFRGLLESRIDLKEFDNQWVRIVGTLIEEKVAALIDIDLA